MTHTRKKLDEKSAHKGSPYTQNKARSVPLRCSREKGRESGEAKKCSKRKKKRGESLRVTAAEGAGEGKKGEGFLFECVEKKRRERGVSEGGGYIKSVGGGGGEG